jgi:diguanylate cyclase
MPTAVTLALTLIQGVGIMALVTMCYSHVERSGASGMNKSLLHGLAFGVGSVFCLVLATEVESGVFIDARNLFIAFSAAFCGPVALAVTLVLTAVTRIMMGGVAIYAGLLGLVIAGAGGLFWRYVVSRRIQNRELALTVLGLLTALSLFRFITLPSETSLPLLMVISSASHCCRSHGRSDARLIHRAGAALAEAGTGA